MGLVEYSRTDSLNFLKFSRYSFCKISPILYLILHLMISLFYLYLGL